MARETRLPLGPLRGFVWFRRARLSVGPVVGVASAVVVAALTLLVDHFLVSRSLPSWLPIFSGSTDTARSILSLIAASMASLIALLFTVVAVVVQLASQQFSPRALRTLLQDVASHIAFGALLGAFTYALVVLQALRVTVEANQVVSVSVTVAFVAAIIDLAIFVVFADHLLHEARVTSIIDRIADRTRRAISEAYPAELEDPYPYPDGERPAREDAVGALTADQAGVLLELNTEAVVELARARDAFIHIVPATGDFVPSGATLMEVHGSEDISADDLRPLVTLDPERSITQDVAFGFRLLVDIAERSLSPAVNDPTTAVACLDHLHDFLRLMSRRHLPTGLLADEDGTVRAYVPAVTWDHYVMLACAEIRHYGEGSLQVIRRMRGMLLDIEAHAPEERRPAVRAELAVLDALAERSFPDELDRARARVGDWQGIGSANAEVPTPQN